MTSQRWNRFVGARRPLTPVTDRADCARAIAVVDSLTRTSIADPLVQAYVNFTATAVEEWEREHDDLEMDPAS